ncbi:MAG: glycosyltransferase [Deltaproteobacteria bacterium]
MSSRSAIDIIVVNYRSASDVITALAPLLPWQHGCVWVVENTEDSLEADYLREKLSDHIRLLTPTVNLGFGKGCNLAFDSSTAPYIFLLNPDARIKERDILLLAEEMDCMSCWGALAPATFWDPEHRFLIPSLLPETPTVWAALSLANKHPCFARLLFSFYLKWQQRLMSAKGVSVVDFLSGSVMLVRREAALRSGGLFDPRYFMFYEDADLSQRLRHRGYKLGILPKARSVHEWRNKPFKLHLMAESGQIYRSLHFPLTSKIRIPLNLFGRALCQPNSHQWSTDLGSLNGPAELNARLKGRGVMALSPNRAGIPAIFRPAGTPPAIFEKEDWSRLEPGTYTIVCGEMDKIRKIQYWMTFKKMDRRPA